jgi:hypothetical protein
MIASLPFGPTSGGAFHSRIDGDLEIAVERTKSRARIQLRVCTVHLRKGKARSCFPDLVKFLIGVSQMDLTKLATEIAVFLAPFFPYLILAGEATAKEVGKKLGEAAWKKAESVWNKIQNPQLIGVAEALAESPSDEDFQTALAKLLFRHLEACPELATELMYMIHDDEAVQTVIVEYGSKVKSIQQRLSKTGRQEATIRGSQAGDIIQEQ